MEAGSFLRKSVTVVQSIEYGVTIWSHTAATFGRKTILGVFSI